MVVTSRASADFPSGLATAIATWRVDSSFSNCPSGPPTQPPLRRRRNRTGGRQMAPQQLRSGLSLGPSGRNDPDTKVLQRFDQLLMLLSAS